MMMGGGKPMATESPANPAQTDETTTLDHLAPSTTHTVSGTLNSGPTDGVVQVTLSSNGQTVPVDGASNNEGHLLRASDGYPQTFSFTFESPADVAGLSLRILSATAGWNIDHTVEAPQAFDFSQLSTTDKTKHVGGLPFSTTVERQAQFDKWQDIQDSWQAEGTGDTISSANAVQDNKAFLHFFELGAFDFDHRWADAYRDYLGWLNGSPPAAWPVAWGWSGFVNGFLSFRQWLTNIQGANPGDYQDLQDDF